MMSKFEEFSNLRKRKNGKQSAWSIEEIRAGLEYYKELYGEYPSSHQIDEFEYLPSARSIQRSLGGLVSMRTQVGFSTEDINHTTGKRRSEKAKITYSNAITYEDKFYKLLKKHIPEIRIHEHKILRPGHVCCDFFIYTSDNWGIAIDIFYAQDLFTLARILTIKSNRYQTIKYPTYFVLVGNKNITQEEINQSVMNKKNKLPEHIKVLTENSFMESIKVLTLYK